MFVLFSYLQVWSVMGKNIYVLHQSDRYIQAQTGLDSYNSKDKNVIIWVVADIKYAVFMFYWDIGT